MWWLVGVVAVVVAVATYLTWIAARVDRSKANMSPVRPSPPVVSRSDFRSGSVVAAGTRRLVQMADHIRAKRTLGVTRTAE